MNWCILFLGGIPHLCTLKMMIFSLRWQVAQWNNMNSKLGFIFLFFSNFVISLQIYVMNNPWKQVHENDDESKSVALIFLHELSRIIYFIKSFSWLTRENRCMKIMIILMMRSKKCCTKFFTWHFKNNLLQKEFLMINSWKQVQENNDDIDDAK